jgi:hypothetical protein
VEIRSYADAMSIRIRVRKLDPGSPGPVFPTLQAVQGLLPPPGQEASAIAQSIVPGDVAQLGEHLLCTQGVTGSSPVISTRTLSTE